VTALLTTYNAIVCDDCSHDFPEHKQAQMLRLTEADFSDVWGYDTAICEECKTVLYDGLAAGVR
jgi:hypothetical protein